MHFILHDLLEFHSWIFWKLKFIPTIKSWTLHLLVICFRSGQNQCLLPQSSCLPPPTLLWVQQQVPLVSPKHKTQHKAKQHVKLHEAASACQQTDFWLRPLFWICWLILQIVDSPSDVRQFDKSCLISSKHRRAKVQMNASELTVCQLFVQIFAEYTHVWGWFLTPLWKIVHWGLL